MELQTHFPKKKKKEKNKSSFLWLSSHFNIFVVFRYEVEEAGD